MKTKSSRSSVAERFIRLITSRPWVALGLALVIAAAVIPAGLARVYSDVSYRIWFRDDDPYLMEYDAFQARFGNDAAVVLVVHSPSGIFDADSAPLIVDLTNQMREITDVIRVDSLVTYNWVHAEEDTILIDPILPEDVELTPALLAERRAIALKDEQLPGYLISRDGRTTLIYGWLRPIKGPAVADKDDPAPNAIDDATIMKEVGALVAKYKGRSDHIFHVTGTPMLENTFKTSNKQDSRRLLPLLFGISMVVLFIFLRRPSAVFISMLTLILSVTAGVACAGWLRLGLNSITLLLPVVLVAVTLAYAVNLLSAVNSALRAGRSRAEAVEHALDKYLVPMFYANLATAFGFISFVTARVIPLRDLGILATLGCGFAWLFVHLVLMPLCVVLPLRPGSDVHTAGTDLDVPTPRVQRVASWVDRHRWRIVGVFVVILVASIAIGSRNEVKYDSFTLFAKDSALNRAHDFLEKNVGWVRSAEVLVDSGQEEGMKDPAFLQKVDALQQSIASQPFVSRTFSVVDILKATNRALHGDDAGAYRIPETRGAVAEQFLLYTMNLRAGQDLNDRVAIRGDAIRITVWWTLRDSVKTFQAIDEIKRKAAELGLNIQVTGRGTLYQLMSNYFVKTFLESLAIALVLISLALWACFRSLVQTLLTLLPNLVALAIGFVVFYLGGRPIDMTAILVYSVALGFAVDNTVYVAMRFQKLSALELTPEQLLGRVYTAYGPAMIIGVFVLAASFSVLMMASYIPLRWFGIMTVTIMLAALISDLLLTPALMLIMVRRWRKRATPPTP